jgi:hypothetical protein
MKPVNTRVPDCCSCSSSLGAIDNRCSISCSAEGLSGANGDLTFEQRQHLDRLLELRGESRETWLGWLRQAIGAANPNNILACIERLTFIPQFHISIEWARRFTKTPLVQIAREGAGTDVAHLRSVSPERRYATLVATVLDTATILIDARTLSRQAFNKAHRKHLGSFQEQGKAINDKVRL